MKEDTQRLCVRIVAWGGWAFTFVFAYLRAADVIPRSWSVFAVMAVGMSILAGLSISRQRLTDTITAALKMGYELAKEEHVGMRARIEALETDSGLRKRPKNQSLSEESRRHKVRQGGPDDGGR